MDGNKHCKTLAKKILFYPDLRLFKFKKKKYVGGSGTEETLTWYSAFLVSMKAPVWAPESI